MSLAQWSNLFVYAAMAVYAAAFFAFAASFGATRAGALNGDAPAVPKIEDAEPLEAELAAVPAAVGSGDADAVTTATPGSPSACEIAAWTTRGDWAAVLINSL